MNINLNHAFWTFNLKMSYFIFKNRQLNLRSDPLTEKSVVEENHNFNITKLKKIKMMLENESWTDKSVREDCKMWIKVKYQIKTLSN